MRLNRKLDLTDDGLYADSDESRVRESAESAHGHDHQWRVLA
jgi:hypothetical protein